VFPSGPTRNKEKKGTCVEDKVIKIVF